MSMAMTRKLASQFRGFARQVRATSRRRRTRTFVDIKNRNDWGDSESVSGVGSNWKQTERLRSELGPLLASLGIRSLVDAPCGDLNWLPYASLDLDEYFGVDIVADLIFQHQEHAPVLNGKYAVMDLVDDVLPLADAILCRDCLVHMPYLQAQTALDQFRRSGATFLITTTFPGAQNHDIPLGGWRALDLQAPPFNLPTPLILLNEGCTEGDGAFAHKSLGVWRLSSTDPK
jgi:hypothetical protein